MIVYPTLASIHDCTGCAACVDSCALSALEMQYSNDGHLMPILNKDLCIGCKNCEKTCPAVQNFQYTCDKDYTAFAGWARNDVLRKMSATAGAFTGLAQFVLSKSGVVFGVTMNGTYAEHISIHKIEDLYKLQGSKYTQSNATNAYKSVLEFLKKGKIVLFSGTGCQVAGLYSFLKNKKYHGELITVDIICGGVPSRLLIDKFIENEPYTIKGIRSFRTKENGWKAYGFKYNLKIEDINGEIHDYTNKRNLIIDGFGSGITNRYSCYKCKFAGDSRMSDFTIGDYWGITEFPDQVYNGVSAIIAHNENAIRILSSAEDYLEIHETKIEHIKKSNRRLNKCNDLLYKLPERRFLSKLFSILSYKTLNRIYAFDFSSKSLWMIYKAYRAIAAKLLIDTNKH